MERRPVVGTGWKLYINTMAEARTLMLRLREAAEAFPEVETFLFPAAAHLPLAQELLSHGPMGYGFQHICQWESGGYTGENSIALLADLGGGYAEIGHAERRGLYHEGDREVNQKVRLCEKFGIVPVVCVGEREEELTLGQNRMSLKSQCLWAFDGVSPDFLERAILVYEPVWAIGKAQPAQPEYVQQVHAYLRECVRREHGDRMADRLRIIYGGSNTPQTSPAFLEQPDVDGLFVGRSALDPENFQAILETARKVPPDRL